MSHRYQRYKFEEIAPPDCFIDIYISVYDNHRIFFQCRCCFYGEIWKTKLSVFRNKKKKNGKIKGPFWHFWETPCGQTSLLQDTKAKLERMEVFLKSRRNTVIFVVQSSTNMWVCPFRLFVCVCVQKNFRPLLSKLGG